MRRRTLLRRIGATGLATAAFAGSSTARTRPGGGYGIDREIDVSAVSGQVTLETLLTDAELGELDDRVDPARRVFTVSEDADAIVLSDCCVYCCEGPDKVCDCGCCECDFECA